MLRIYNKSKNKKEQERKAKEEEEGGWYSLPLEMAHYILNIAVADDKVTSVLCRFVCQQWRAILSLKVAKEDYLTLCPLAARRGELEILKWLIAHGCPCEKIPTWHAAAAGGKIAVLSWLKHNLAPFSNSEWLEITKVSAYGAVREGHLEVLKWLKSEEEKKRERNKKKGRRGKGGSLAGFSKSVSSKKVFHLAIEKGDLTLLKWLKNEGECQWDDRCCPYAAGLGHLEVLEWMIEEGCPHRPLTLAWWAMGGLPHSRRVLDWLKQRDMYTTAIDPALALSSPPNSATITQLPLTCPELA